MALTRVVVEMGMGTDIRGGDYTKAAIRALRDALWHNSLSLTRALGMDIDSMQVEVTIGVPQPDAVDKAQVLAILPPGTGEVTVVPGGREYSDGFQRCRSGVCPAYEVIRPATGHVRHQRRHYAPGRHKPVGHVRRNACDSRVFSPNLAGRAWLDVADPIRFPPATGQFFVAKDQYESGHAPR